ncbi:MAG TPA: hypothetical protein VEM39_12260 [Myxococcaceae bacterium]|nr:hypothetical protein [Myxococcaceae bacterium]
MSPAQKFNRAVRTALLLTGCGLLGACDAGGFPGWRKLAALGMGPRQETAVAAHGGRIYVLGGFTATLAIVNRVEAYDPAADEWVETPSLPIAMHHANAGVVDGRIYVVGALIGAGFAAIGDAYVYDPGANATHLHAPGYRAGRWRHGGDWNEDLRRWRFSTKPIGG